MSLASKEHDDMIISFSGKYDFLSNFHPAIVHLDGINYPTVEHGFVSAKTDNYMDKIMIASLDANQAGKAKRMGRKFDLVEDWEDIKLDVMKRLLMQKFMQHEFRTKLLATGDKTLVEGNYWHDNYWGTCMCDRKEPCKYHGKNMLGKLLMEVREIVELK